MISTALLKSDIVKDRKRPTREFGHDFSANQILFTKIRSEKTDLGASNFKTFVTAHCHACTGCSFDRYL